MSGKSSGTASASLGYFRPKKPAGSQARMFWRSRRHPARNFQKPIADSCCTVFTSDSPSEYLVSRDVISNPQPDRPVYMGV